MIRFLVLTIILSFTILAQTVSTIVSYDVSVAINDRTQEIAGTVRTDVLPADAASKQYSFLVPKAWEIQSLRNRENDSYDDDRSASTSPNFDIITLDLSDKEQRSDTLSVNITFSFSLDSSSIGDMFINQQQFLLPYNSTVSWLPLFGSMSTERFSLELNGSPQFTVIAEESFDTSSAENILLWKRNSSKTEDLSSAFTLCGLRSAVKQTAFSSDSLFSVSWYSSPGKFNQRFAAAITRQLCEANQYLRILTNRQRITHVSYAFVGEGKYHRAIFNNTKFVVHRNSPAYSIFDSASITQATRNPWLLHIARQFCPANTDSTAVFDDGFASYLAMRFLRSTHPLLERQERLTTISNALTFFPAGTLAAGRTTRSNTNEFVSFKGRYIFLMLEHLLGKESFDSVISVISDRFSDTTITFSNFQQLCEEQYGSSLEWFFAQWLNRSSAPEFVMQWKSDTTPRGMSIVRTTIEQRGDLFSIPVPLVFSFGSRAVTKQILVEQEKQEFTFTFPSVPTAVELDPRYSVLRWLLELRISAHAKTSLQFLSINRDVSNAEREAQYTLQLDPNNSTGSAPLAYFVLGNISALNGDGEKAKEYFMKAASSSATDESDPYKLLSLVRYGNIEENNNKREDAVSIYQRARSVGMNNPLIFERAIIEAEYYLREKFIPSDDVWYDIH